MDGMGISFCFGASGAGKSTYLQKLAVSRDEENILFVVPDQYTMQTQKELVEASPSHGIMNIDVLSFGRLAHRVFEETGADPRAVLDDIGKSLLLRRIAEKKKDELRVLSGSIGRLGMIAEIKSVISEFMQYDVAPEKVAVLEKFAGERGQGALTARLADLRLLYESFLEEKKARFITSEETMDLLAEAIPSSALIAKSTIIFDGFTGFTPVQNRVLSELVRCAREVIVSLTISEDGGLTPQETEKMKTAGPEEALFYLTRKTVKDLTELAAKAGAPRRRDVYAVMPEEVHRSPALEHLERQLFRHPAHPYHGKKEEKPAIELIEASTIEEEVRQVFRTIRLLSLKEGYAYRDFAVVTGDPESYNDEIEKQAMRFHIPVYVDRTRGILQNPLTESIRSALTIINEAYSYESIFHYLRSGMSDLKQETVDRLENYVLANGIRGRRKWGLPIGESDELEAARKRFLEEIAPLEKDERPGTAAVRTERLYAFLTGIDAQEKLENYARGFAEEGDPVREMEYSQIYREILSLLDQIHDLIGDEKISAEDFVRLLDTGFQEIRLGTLPQQVDRVIAGDIERTRLSGVSVLFMVGVNDGAIPRGTSRGGLLSDPDRELLRQSGVELSGTPREQMFIQRFYLYLNMTKARDRLVVSYARMAEDGSALRPSYLIPLLQRLYPDAQLLHPELDAAQERISTPQDACLYLADSLREYADGTIRDPETFLTIYGYTAQREAAHPDEAAYPESIRFLKETAFLRYRPERLSHQISLGLYGQNMISSVSRLETGAQCMMRHFLQYGLHLMPRDEFIITPMDSGTVLHDSIERFSRTLLDRGISWQDLTPEQEEELVELSLEQASASYHGLLMYDSERSTYNLQRMKRVLRRTVDTLRYQLLQGAFEPCGYELPFGEDPQIRFRLETGQELRLVGRIDRMDLCVRDEQVLVKILDYKSGYRDLKPDLVLRGLQLQLIIYMDAALKMMEKRYPGRKIEPAALLYYRFRDPVIAADPDKAAEMLEEASDGPALSAEKELLKSLRPTGMVNSDETILRLMDRNLTTTSDVIPVRMLSQGKGIAKSAFALSTEEFDAFSEEVKEVICRIAGTIADGSTEASPAVLDSRRTACTYCPYRDVCGFDRKLPGFAFRTE